MTNYVVTTPSNDVVVGNPLYVEAKTGTSTIKPGMFVRFSDDRTVTIGTAANAIGGFALYKETNPKYQKSAVGSTYDKGDYIAVALAGPCFINAFVDGTVSAGDPLKPSTGTAGYLAKWTGTSAAEGPVVAVAVKGRNGAGQTMVLIW